MAIKTDLTDVTFLIPIRIDSIDRLENLVSIISFINKHFITRFQLLEASNYNNHILSKLLPDNVSIHFMEDYDPVFHRTYYINRLIEKAKTPIVAIWDSDVLLTESQIMSAVDLIRKKEADFILPYKRKFLNTSMIVRELYLRNKDFDILKEHENKMEELYAPDPVGGCFIANRKSYVASGKENENFYGWGHEDGERVNRWENLGYKLLRIDGCLYHLSHHRSMNSTYHSKKQPELKNAELESLAFMSETELEREIREWSQ